MRKGYSILILIFINLFSANAQELIYFNTIKNDPNRQFYQSININISKPTNRLKIIYYLINKNDTIISVSKSQTKPHTGFNEVIIENNDAKRNSRSSEKYLTTAKQYNTLPVGKYEYHWSLTEDDTITHTGTQIVHFDSSITSESVIFNNINKSLYNIINTDQYHIEDLLPNSIMNLQVSNPIMRYVKSSILDGLASQFPELKITDSSQNNYFELHFNDGNHYLGYYKIDNKELINILQQTIKNKAAGLVNQMFQSSADQLNTIKEQLNLEIINKKSENSIDGKVKLMTNYANNTDNYSYSSPKFAETDINLNLILNDIPINITSYYTTQDIHRKVKSSYFKINLDIESVKKQIEEKTNEIKNKAEQSINRANGMESFYKNSLTSLKSKQSEILSAVITRSQKLALELKDTILARAINDSFYPHSLTDTAQLRKVIYSKFNDQIDSLQSKTGISIQKIDSIKQEIENLKTTYEEHKQKLDDLIEKYEKYEALYQNYKSKANLDSLYTYSKIGNTDELKTKGKEYALAKAKNLIPKNSILRKLDKFKEFEIGNFYKTVSPFTIDGQNLKGLSLGFALNPNLAFYITGGRTQYVSVNGNVDNYNCFMNRFVISPNTNQKVSINYYQYGTNIELAKKDSFFNQVEVPSFKSNHIKKITSLQYESILFHKINIEAELAANIGTNNKISKDYALNVSSTIDLSLFKSSQSLDFTYSKINSGFENQTLPILMSGTQLFKGKFVFSTIKDYIKISASYYKFKRENTYTNAFNTKIGFEIKTQFKRYPNLSIAYKPYSSIQNPIDTIQINTKPLLGNLLTGRLSYQFKNKKNQYRFSFDYNKNEIVSDTGNISYQNYQGVFMFNNPKYVIAQTFGLQNLPVVDSSQQSTMNAFIYTASYQIKAKKIDYGIAYMFSFRHNHIIKYNIQANTSYSFPNKPIRLFLNFNVGQSQNIDNPLYRWIILTRFGIDYTIKKIKF